MFPRTTGKVLINISEKKSNILIVTIRFFFAAALGFNILNIYGDIVKILKIKMYTVDISMVKINKK